MAVVNNTLAQRFWGGAANAIGKRVRVAEGDWRTVIGVAADVKYSRINEAPRPYICLPFFQSYRSGMILHTRGAAAVDSLVNQARARIAALDADLPILRARPMDRDRRGALLRRGLRHRCGTRVTRLLGSLLFGVSATDGISFARALALVLDIVLVATIVPAWRAARTNPLRALRHQ